MHIESLPCCILCRGVSRLLSPRPLCARCHALRGPWGRDKKALGAAAYYSALGEAAPYSMPRGPSGRRQWEGGRELWILVESSAHHVYVFWCFDSGRKCPNEQAHSTKTIFHFPPGLANIQTYSTKSVWWGGSLFRGDPQRSPTSISTESPAHHFHIYFFGPHRSKRTTSTHTHTHTHTHKKTVSISFID